MNDLPGRPTKRLVRDVRRTLWTYMRSRPHQLDERWRLAWEWAAKQADDSLTFQFKRPRRRWPAPVEIASRYLLLSLIHMQTNGALRLGYKAGDHQPESVKAFIRREMETLEAIGKKPTGLLEHLQ